MRAFIKCLALSLVGTLTMLLLKRLIHRAYKRSVEKYSVDAGADSAEPRV